MLSVHSQSLLWCYFVNLLPVRPGVVCALQWLILCTAMVCARCDVASSRSLSQLQQPVSQSQPPLQPGGDIASPATRWTPNTLCWHLTQECLVRLTRVVSLPKLSQIRGILKIYFLFQLNRIVFMRIESQFILSSRPGQCLTSLSKPSHKLDIKILSFSHTRSELKEECKVPTTSFWRLWIH